MMITTTTTTTTMTATTTTMPATAPYAAFGVGWHREVDDQDDLFDADQLIMENLREEFGDEEAFDAFVPLDGKIH